MAKRFTDTEKWTKNKWFRKLPVNYKLLWLFILDNCDCVGVWEEDIEFVATLLNIDISSDEAIKNFEKQIQLTSRGRKWWIKNFCFYQYGELKEENIKNKPHQKYISELKKHRLWIDYTKTIHSLKEKEEEKEEENDKEKANAKFLIPEMMNTFQKYIPDYMVSEADDLSALGEIAVFICKQSKISYQPQDETTKLIILTAWESIAEFVKEDKFYKSFSLKSIKNNIQSICQKLRDGKKDNKTAKPGSKVSGERINEAFAAFYS